MVNPNSERRTWASSSWFGLLDASDSGLCLGVIPLFPVFWEPGACGVSFEEEGDKPTEEDVGMSVVEELGDPFEGDDPAEG